MHKSIIKNTFTKINHCNFTNPGARHLISIAISFAHAISLVVATRFMILLIYTILKK